MHGSLVARASPICGPPPFRHEHNTALHKRYTISTSMHGLPLRSSIRWSFRAITVGSAAGWPAFHRGVETRARGGERRSTGAQAADARVALRSLLSIAAKNQPRFDVSPQLGIYPMPEAYTPNGNRSLPN